MIVAVDVDGVVADLGTAWLNRYNKEYNDNLTNKDIHSWDTHLYVKPECGKKIYKYIEDPTLYDEVLPIPGALEAIKFMKTCDMRIIFVTTSTLGASGAKFNWLKRYGFINSLKDYIECSDKSLIRADILIDDKYENVRDFPENSVLFKQPWNKDCDWNGLRIYGWEGFLYD